MYPSGKLLDTVHAPPFWQGWDSHTLNLPWHLRPKHNIMMVKLNSLRRVFLHLHWEAGAASSCLTCEARLADTLVIIGQLDAVKTVGGIAGVRETLVNVSLTSLSCESRGTIAAISTHSVHTGAIIQALRRSIAHPQGRSTVIFINLTENTCKGRSLLILTYLNFWIFYSHIVTNHISCWIHAHIPSVPGGQEQM